MPQVKWCALWPTARPPARSPALQRQFGPAPGPRPLRGGRRARSIELRVAETLCALLGADCRPGRERPRASHLHPSAPGATRPAFTCSRPEVGARLRFRMINLFLGARRLPGAAGPRKIEIRPKRAKLPARFAALQAKRPIVCRRNLANGKPAAAATAHAWCRC